MSKPEWLTTVSNQLPSYMSSFWSFPCILPDIFPYFFSLFSPSLCIFFTLVLSVVNDKSNDKFRVQFG